MADAVYKSIHTGQKIDEGISFVLSGNLDKIVEITGENADSAKNSAYEASISAAQAADSAESAKQYSGNPPKPQYGTWWIWNADTGQYVDTGAPVVLTPNQSYPSVADMEADFRNTRLYDLAMIYGATENEDTGKVYINNGEEWFYLSDLSGPRGPQGIQGPEGPQGEPGKNGVVMSAAGMFAFYINDEDHLIMVCDGEPRDFYIDEDTGHLHFRFSA